jgi:hypothetical protein
MARLLFAIWLAGCAVDAPALPLGHPANPASPPGRLASPPDAFGSAAAPPAPRHPMTMPMP